MLVATIKIGDNELREILTAILFDFGAQGVNESERMVEVYFNQATEPNTVIEALAAANLERFKIDFHIEEAQNWNEIWESSFEPVIIRDRVGIRSTFHQPLQVEHELVINPKMAFGTGHHETTSMVIAFMLDLQMKGSNVLDFGTGTGVLAILAEKLGAHKIVAIDNDVDSIENATENFEVNDCSKIQLLAGEKGEIPKEKFDLVLANITRNVIIDSFEEIQNALGADACLILSGFIPDDIDAIKLLAREHGLHCSDFARQGKWACLKFDRQRR